MRCEVSRSFLSFITFSYQSFHVHTSSLIQYALIRGTGGAKDSISRRRSKILNDLATYFDKSFKECADVKRVFRGIKTGSKGHILFSLWRIPFVPLFLHFPFFLGGISLFRWTYPKITSLQLFVTLLQPCKHPCHTIMGHNSDLFVSKHLESSSLQWKWCHTQWLDME